MKRTVIFLAIVAFLGSCKDNIYQEYMTYVPVYTDYETFRSKIGVEGPKNIEQKGNIYFKDDHLFMVEPDKGIHIIDNSNPSAPNQTAFLNVWGASSMAIRDNYLYVNSFIDLAVFDISSISNPVFVDRVEDAFPTALPYSEKNYPYEPIDKSKGVVTSWEVKEVREDVSESNPNPTWVNPVQWGISVAFEDASFIGGGNGSGTTGIAGSISLFTIIDNHLYCIEEGRFLHPFDLANPSMPEKHDPVSVWGDIETLFPYKDYLFMGTPTGMIVYGTADPNNPVYISSIGHARGCDPVVVENDYAYVTVRSGGPCGGDINQLDVIDISSISNPLLLASFEMKNPHGLGIDGDRLFICDGEAGLKVFDATNPVDVGNHQLHRFKNIQATDVIPFDNIAMVIGDDGIYQYDYSNPEEMNLLSKIEF